VGKIGALAGRCNRADFSAVEIRQPACSLNGKVYVRDINVLCLLSRKFKLSGSLWTVMFRKSTSGNLFMVVCLYLI